jgi:uncharacterized protein Smg (DUF494 family)
MKSEKHYAGSASGRILEIITLLLGEMRERKELAEVDTRKLAEKGYSEMEISTAFSWLFDKLALSMMQVEFVQETPKNFVKGREQFRPFHEFERNLLSKDAQGYLLQLRELGLLSDQEMETIIDRAWFFGAQNVGLETLHELAAQVIFDFNDASRSGSRMMLNIGDRVQ